MTDIDDMTLQYQKMYSKMILIKALLGNILFRFGVISELEKNTLSFSSLIAKIPEIKSVTVCDTSILPTDETLHFNDSEEVVDFLYTDNSKQYNRIATFTVDNGTIVKRTVPEINLLLVRKIDFYCKFLKAYLFNVGVSNNDIPNDLYGLVNALNRVQRIHPTYIVLDDFELYKNSNNNIPIVVRDDNDDPVTNGQIQIYDGNTLIYTYSIGDNIIIKPTVTGLHNYTFKYVPSTNDYYESEIARIINVMPGKIEVTITPKNNNPYSALYNTETAYYDDQWQVTIEMKDTLNTILSDIPFDLFIEDELLCSGQTDFMGKYVYTGTPQYSSIPSRDMPDLRFIVKTKVSNHTYSNVTEEYYVMLLHHLLEADDIYYLGSVNNYVSIKLCDEYTGEPFITEHREAITVNDIILTAIDNGLWHYSMDNSLLQAGNYLLHIEGHINDDTWYGETGDVYVVEYDDVDYQHNVQIKSNFILPDEHIFYIPNVPIIYYKPLGETKNSTVTVTLTKDNSTIINNQTLNVVNGLIDISSFCSTIGEYSITLTSNANDGVIENVQYSFDVRNPMKLEQISYNKTGCAIYRATIYDKTYIDGEKEEFNGFGYSGYNIAAPAFVTADLLNDGYSAISIYDDEDENIVNITNKFNEVKIDYNNNITTTTFSKTRNDWQNFKIYIYNDKCEIYVNNNLLKSININVESIKVILMSVTGYYRNFNADSIYQPISVINTDTNNDVEYTYTRTETDDAYVYTVNICRANNPNAEGHNKIIVRVGDYLKYENFELYEKIFEILNNNFKVGANTIQVKCYDTDVTQVTLSHNNIATLHTTLNNHVFNIRCNIYQAGTLSINITNDELDNQLFDINVAKGDYTIELLMPETKEYQNHDPIPLSIRDAFDNEINTFYCWFDSKTPLNITKPGDSIILVNNTIGQQYDTLEMGTHTINVRPIEDSNYNSVIVTKEFILGVYITTLTNQPIFTNLLVDNDGWLLNESMNIDNNTTIADLENTLIGINTTVNVDPGQLILSNFISSDTNLDSIILLDDDFHNIQDAIIDMDIEGNKLTYDTIEDDNL